MMVMMMMMMMMVIFLVSALKIVPSHLHVLYHLDVLWVDDDGDVLKQFQLEFYKTFLQLALTGENLGPD